MTKIVCDINSTLYSDLERMSVAQNKSVETIAEEAILEEINFYTLSGSYTTSRKNATIKAQREEMTKFRNRAEISEQQVRNQNHEIKILKKEIAELKSSAVNSLIKS